MTPLSLLPGRTVRRRSLETLFGPTVILVEDQQVRDQFCQLDFKSDKWITTGLDKQDFSA